jgi:hypothetical protein
MTRSRTGKKLNVLDAEVEALEQQRRALELRALGAEVSDAERRSRYFSVADPALRRELIGLERALHDKREQQRALALEYWTTTAAETRAKVADLTSGSPTSRWRRSLWWDLLTLFWILAGAGWLGFGIPGALIGAALSAVSAWFVVRSRERMRLASVREGEELLRSSERELAQARLVATGTADPTTTFSQAEEQSGVPDARS